MADCKDISQVQNHQQRSHRRRNINLGCSARYVQLTIVYKRSKGCSHIHIQTNCFLVRTRPVGCFENDQSYHKRKRRREKFGIPNTSPPLDRSASMCRLATSCNNRLEFSISLLSSDFSSCNSRRAFSKYLHLLFSLHQQMG